ncbi:hypothetical protein C8J56DRAFT_267420 [Mycena floridula]|nr:hypothetical protein C8J56DRAFT_267420 [Mycena floridula]
MGFDLTIMERVLSPEIANSDVLLELNLIREEQHNAVHRAYSAHQRKQSDDPSPELQLAWYRSMKLVLKEIDEEIKVVPFKARITFLDVGCCPGGFSSYILSKNPSSIGLGISLPVEDGGHSFLLDEHLQYRFELHWSDITQYQLGPSPYNSNKLRALPFASASFDLVLLDGHPLRQGGKRYSPYKSDILLISQLIIGLQAVSWGGTVVIKLARPERPLTARILYLFDKLSLSLATWKPICMHATRDTFYAVAKGFGYGREGQRRMQLLAEMRGLWSKLTYSKHIHGLLDGDLNFIVDDLDLQYAYGERLQQLSQHIWIAQAASLKGWKEAQF